MTDLHIEVVDRAIAVVTETLPRISRYTHGYTHGGDNVRVLLEYRVLRMVMVVVFFFFVLLVAACE